MAKGQMRSSKEKRKPKAGAKKSVGLAPTRSEAAPSRAEVPSDMYKLFTKGRSVG